MFIQFRVSPLTIWLKQQQFALIVIILYTSFAYTITILNNCYFYNNFYLYTNCYLYNRDLQTITVLVTSNVSSHKTDWILSELALLAMSCLLYRRVNCLTLYKTMLLIFESRCSLVSSVLAYYTKSQSSSPRPDINEIRKLWE